MWYMTLAQLLLKLINAASDGELTVHEVSDIAVSMFPGNLHDIVMAIDEASEDGKITVDEVIDIIREIVT